METDLTEEQAWLMFKEYCNTFETQSACARSLGVSDVYISDVLRRNRPLGAKILEALKLKRVVVYRKTGE